MGEVWACKLDCLPKSNPIPSVENGVLSKVLLSSNNKSSCKAEKPSPQGVLPRLNWGPFCPSRSWYKDSWGTSDKESCCKVELGPLSKVV